MNLQNGIRGKKTGLKILKSFYRFEIILDNIFSDSDLYSFNETRSIKIYG